MSINIEMQNGMEHLGKSVFGMDVSSRCSFGAADIWQMDISTREHFNIGTFRQEDFSAEGIFGTGTLGHEDILAGSHFRTWTFRHSSTGAKMSVPKRPFCFARCQNIHKPKYPCAEMFRCRKVLESKISHVETFQC